MEDKVWASNLDLKEGKCAENLLRKPEQMLRMFSSASLDLIYSMNANWSIMCALQEPNFLAVPTTSCSNWINTYLPAHERARLKKSIDQAVLTKQLFDLEHQVLLADGSVGWAHTRAVPLFDAYGEIEEWFGMASNITARKTIEAERDKNYLLLKQAEELAHTGTWYFDLSTGKLNWSDGMYRLFNLKKTADISPKTYVQYANSTDKELAEKIATHILKVDSDFEETLTIKLNGSDKVLKLKATVVKNELGQPLRVLGVDVDVTANYLAEKSLRQMEAEQQLKIFRATLRAQEEERRRISENLHNGLGQLMYGIKISLNQLNRSLAVSNPKKYDHAKAYAEKLAGQAIQESRNISHELMPATLEKFGLKSAIDDVCKQLTGGVKFNCNYIGIESRLEKYLELAVFRTIQELLVNVVKHANATTANLSVIVNGNQIQVILVDNGQGMPTTATNNQGIGLSSIRNKIKLLNGSVAIKSTPGKGTEIVVKIPAD